MKRITKQELVAENLKLARKLVETEDALKYITKNRDYYSKCKEYKEAEIEELHCIIDCLPNPPPRHYPIIEGDIKAGKAYSIQARLVGGIARMK